MSAALRGSKTESLKAVAEDVVCAVAPLLERIRAAGAELDGSLRPALQQLAAAPGDAVASAVAPAARVYALLKHQLLLSLCSNLHFYLLFGKTHDIHRPESGVC